MFTRYYPKIIILFFTLFPLPVHAQHDTLSLEDCIALARENNPQIDVAIEQYEQSLGVETQAVSGYLPRITLGTSAGRVHVEDLQPEDEDNVAQAGISASQLIYDFGKTIGGIESSRFSRDATVANVEQIIHDVVFEVREAFYLVLEKEILVVVAEQAVSNYKQHLYRAGRYYEAGVRTQIDITNAELELANSKLNLLRARADVKSARVKLEQILGIRPNQGDYQLGYKAKKLEELASSVPELPTSLPQLLTTSKDKRPGLQQLDFLLKATEASVKQVEGDYWPLISATGSYDEYQTDLTSLTDQWQVTALLSWEIFSGFETEGKVAQAKGQVRELQASKRELDLAIVQDVTDSYLRAEENYEAISIASLAVTLARRNLELAEGRYKAGLGDMIEFNDAQLNFTESQSDLVSTYFTYLTALARLDRAVGLNSGLEDDWTKKILTPANGK